VNLVLRNPDVPQQMIGEGGKVLPSSALLRSLAKPIHEGSGAAEQRPDEVLGMGSRLGMRTQRH
jgi:hypothetical protein